MKMNTCKSVCEVDRERPMRLWRGSSPEEKTSDFWQRRPYLVRSITLQPQPTKEKLQYKIDRTLHALQITLLGKFLNRDSVVLFVLKHKYLELRTCHKQDVFPSAEEAVLVFLARYSVTVARSACNQQRPLNPPTTLWPAPDKLNFYSMETRNFSHTQEQYVTTSTTRNQD